MGTLTISPSGTGGLSVSGGALRFAGTTFNGAGVFNLSSAAGAELDLGASSDVGNVLTVNKSGAGTLVLDATATASFATAGTTINVAGGPVVVVGMNGAAGADPLGAAKISLGTGGSLSLSSAGGAVVFNNALTVTDNASVTAGMVYTSNGFSNAGNAITLGGSNGVTVAAGKTLTLSTLDGTFTVAGAVTNNGTITAGAGSVTLSNLATAGTLSANSGGTLVIANSIGGATFAPAAGGTVALSSANSLTGTLNLTAGTVAAGNKGSFGTAILSFNGGGIASTLPLVGANAITNAVALNTAQPIIINGAQDLELTSNIDLSAAGGGQRGIVVNDTSANGVTLSGLLSGVGASINKSGVGRLVLGNSNSFTGGAVISGGSIQMRTVGSVGGGPISVSAGGQLQLGPTGLNLANNITLNGITAGGAIVGGMDNGVVSNTLGGTLTLAATSNLSTSWSDKTLTVAGQITGAGGLQIDKYISTNPAPNITLTNASNNYAGGTILNAGVLNFASGALGTVGNITFGGGTLQWASGNTQDISSRMVLGAGASATLDTNSNNVTLNSALAEGTSLGIVKIGSGSLTIAGTTDNNALAAVVNVGTLILGKTSTSSVHAVGGPAGLTINTGAIAQLGGSGGDQVYDGTGVTVNATGIFDLNGRSEGISALNGNGVVTNTAANSTSTLTIGTFNGSGTFTGTLQNGGTNNTGVVALAKTGTSTITLSTANSHTGGTSVSNGILLVNATSALGSGAVTLTGGTLQTGIANAFKSSATGNADLPVNMNGGAIDFHADSDTTYGGALNISGPATVTLSRVTAGNGTVATMGAMTIGAGNLTLALKAGGGNVNDYGVFGLTTGAVTLSGNPTFTVNTNSFTTGNLTMGAMNDGGTARTLTFNGPGRVTLNSPAASLVANTTINIQNGVVASDNATALGTQANINITGSGIFAVNANQTVNSLSGSGTLELGTHSLTISNAADQIFSGTVTSMAAQISDSKGGFNAATAGSLTHTMYVEKPAGVGPTKISNEVHGGYNATLTNSLKGFIRRFSRRTGACLNTTTRRGAISPAILVCILMGSGRLRGRWMPIALLCRTWIATLAIPRACLSCGRMAVPCD